MPTFNMQYLRAKAPIVWQMIAPTSNGREPFPVKILRKDTNRGTIIPHNIIPIQKIPATRPLSISETDSSAVLDWYEEFSRYVPMSKALIPSTIRLANSME